MVTTGEMRESANSQALTALLEGKTMTGLTLGESVHAPQTVGDNRRRLESCGHQQR